MLDFVQEQEKVRLATSINSLDKLEEIYARELLSLIAQSDKDNYHELSNIFYLLGKVYLRKADFVEGQDDIKKDLKKAECYTDATKFFQYVISLNNRIIVSQEVTLASTKGEERDSKVEESKANIDQIYQILNDISRKLMSLAIGKEFQENNDVSKESAADKLRLEKLREYSKSELAKIDLYLESAKTVLPNEVRESETVFIETSKSLFEYIAVEMRSFLSDLYRDAQEILGTPPCKYAVIGLGSMALQQITPYSDLEFAILTEHNADPEHGGDPVLQRYFLFLTHLVHFKIINLGETVIPKSKYNIDLAQLTRVGVNFDLGGKTPLGRIDKDKPYCLIQNVEGMIHYLRNENSGSEHRDKVLPWILEKVECIYGDISIVEEYKLQVQQFLETKNREGITQYQVRAIKRLSEETVERNYLGIGNPGTIGGHLDAYEPSFEVQNDGKIFDVKQEIYRLVDRLLYDLAFYYGTIPSSVWNASEMLGRLNLLNDDAKHNLLYASSFATILRLRVYAYYNQQNDVVSVFEDLQDEVYCFSHTLFQKDSSLFKYYYTVIPFHKTLSNFIRDQSNCDRNNYFIQYSFREITTRNQAVIYKRLFRYNDAIQCIDRDVQSLDSDTNLRDILGYCLVQVGRSNEAISYLQTNLKIKGLHHPEYITSLIGLGVCFVETQRYTKALCMFDEAISSVPKSLGAQYTEDIVILHNNKGSVLRLLGRYKEALDSYEKALSIPSQQIWFVQSLCGKANVLYLMEQYDTALGLFKDALKRIEHIYGSCHQEAIDVHSSIGLCYVGLNDANNAHRALLVALSNAKIIYKESHHIVARIYGYMGRYYEELMHDYDKSLSQYFKALSIKEQCHGDDVNLAPTFSSIGKIYAKQEKYSEAVQFFRKALNLYIDKFDTNRTATLINLFRAYLKVDDFISSFELLEELYDGSSDGFITLYSETIAYKYDLDSVRMSKFVKRCLDKRIKFCEPKVQQMYAHMFLQEGAKDYAKIAQKLIEVFSKIDSVQLSSGSPQTQYASELERYYVEPKQNTKKETEVTKMKAKDLTSRLETKDTKTISYDMHARDNAFNKFDDITYQYQTADINFIGEEIFKTKQDICHFVGAIGYGVEQISGETILRQALQEQRLDDKRLVGVYNVGSFHWIAFVIIREGEQLWCICRDSMRDVTGDKKNLFESFIKRIYPDITCTYYDGSEQIDKTSCGIFALKNAEILASVPLTLLSSDSEVITIRFYDRQADVLQHRREFAILYAKRCYENTKADIHNAVHRRLLGEYYDQFFREEVKSKILKEGETAETLGIREMSVSVAPDYHYYLVIRPENTDIGLIRNRLHQLGCLFREEDKVIKIDRGVADQQQVSKDQISVTQQDIERDFLDALNIAKGRSSQYSVLLDGVYRSIGWQLNSDVMQAFLGIIEEEVSSEPSRVQDKHSGKEVASLGVQRNVDNSDNVEVQFLDDELNSFDIQLLTKKERNYLWQRAERITFIDQGYTAEDIKFLLPHAKVIKEEEVVNILEESLQLFIERKVQIKDDHNTKANSKASKVDTSTDTTDDTQVEEVQIDVHEEVLSNNNVLSQNIIIIFSRADDEESDLQQWSSIHIHYINANSRKEIWLAYQDPSGERMSRDIYDYIIKIRTQLKKHGIYLQIRDVQSEQQSNIANSGAMIVDNIQKLQRLYSRLENSHARLEKEEVKSSSFSPRIFTDIEINILRLEHQEVLYGKLISDLVIEKNYPKLVDVFLKLGDNYLARGMLTHNPELITESTKYYQYVVSIANKALKERSSKEQREELDLQDILQDRSLEERVLDDGYFHNSKDNAQSKMSQVREALIKAVGGDITKSRFKNTYFEAEADKLYLEQLREYSRIALEEVDEFLDKLSKITVVSKVQNANLLHQEDLERRKVELDAETDFFEIDEERKNVQEDKDFIDILIFRESQRRSWIEQQEIDDRIGIYNKFVDFTSDTGDKIFIERTKGLYAHITEQMKSFLANLYKDAQDILGEPPCSYTVIGLGSMALQQITPYSDLEFAILTESEDYKTNQDPKIKNYFTHLTHLVHFRVINLGESIIPTSRYNVDLSHLTRVGVNFDLGGKTPLGRIDKDKPYSLIQTPEKMAQYLEGKYWHVDKSLPSILEVCVSVYEYATSDKLDSVGKSLVETYKEKIRIFLNNKNSDGAFNYEARAITRLKDGNVEYDYLDLSRSGALRGNVEAYDPRLVIKSGYLFDAKQEIYRLPDRLLYDLAFFYGISPLSVWNTVEQLSNFGIIGTTEQTRQAGYHLLYAASFATTLRLKTYLYHDAQNENVWISGIDETSEHFFSLKLGKNHKCDPIFKYYYTALSIYDSLTQFLSNHLVNSRKFFHGIEFYDQQSLNIANIYFRLLKFEGALAFLQNAVRQKPYDMRLKKYLGKLYVNVGMPDKAESLYREMLHHFHKFQSDDRKLLADLNFNIACLLSRKFNVLSDKKAIENCKIALSHYEDIKNIFECNLQIANIYTRLEDREKALEYLNIALYKFKFLESEDAIYKSRKMEEIGHILFQFGQYQSALKYYKIAHSLLLTHPSYVFYLEFASSIENIGITFCKLDMYQESIKTLLYAYKVQILINRRNPELLTINLAKICMHLANSYSCAGMLEEAQQYRKMVVGKLIQQKEIVNLDTMLLGYSNVPHSFNYITYSFAGNQCSDNHDYQGAMQNYILALQNANDLRSKADAYSNIAFTYIKLGDMKSALRYFNQVLQMQYKIHTNHDDSNIADVHMNIALVYCELQDHISATKNAFIAFRKILTHSGNVRQEFYRIYITNIVDKFSKQFNLDAAQCNQILEVCLEKGFDFTSYNIQLQLALWFFNKGILDVAVEAYKIALTFIEQDINASVRAKQSIYHNLGCTYNVLAIHLRSNEKTEVSEINTGKAQEAFHKAIGYARNTENNAGLYTEYANFLLEQNNYKEAFHYLQQVIGSNDNNSKLGYGEIEKCTVVPLLQQAISTAENKQIEVIAIHYAYYLLILHYNKFVEVGVEGVKSREEYIALFYSLDVSNNDIYNLMLQDVRMIGESMEGSEVVVQEIPFIGRVEVVYNNPLLNYKYLGSILSKAYEVGGVALVNRLIDLDQVTARAIIDTVETRGIESFFAKASYDHIPNEDRGIIISLVDKEVILHKDVKVHCNGKTSSFAQKASWFSSYLKRWIYRSEIKQLKQLLGDKNIQMSWQESLSDNHWKKVSLKLHPDTGGTKEDFQFYNEFRQKFNEQDIEPIIRELQHHIHKTCHQLSVTFKVLDLGVDTIRVYYKPTGHNIADLAIGGSHLLSMTTGITKFSIAGSVISVGYKYYEGGVYEAAKSAAMSIVFMGAPYVLTFTGIPYVGVVYTMMLTVYTGINLVNNVISLYQELSEKDLQLKSTQAYNNMYQAIYQLTNNELFSGQASEQETTVGLSEQEVENELIGLVGG